MTKNLSYLIELTYDRAYKGYVANVVNLYGCMSQGKTKKEALSNVKKAIRAYMEVIEKTEYKQNKSSTFHEVVNIPTPIASI